MVEKTGGRISEKWFYTHIKNDSDKLPRIDILNLLAQFLAYKDWYDFKNQHEKTTISTPNSIVKTEENTSKKSNNKSTDTTNPKSEKQAENIPSNKETSYSKYLFSLFPFIILGLYSLWQFLQSSPEEISFCFFDSDRKTVILHPIEVEVLRPNESSVFYKTNDKGCLSIPNESEILKFIVRSPYYEADTVLRITKSVKTAETIPLRTNDYALMIHYFSVSDVENWKRRREQLNEMIHQDAVIYQIYEKAQIGMDMLNKTEFIDKLTMPINSLKNIQIIDSEYAQEQIISLRFIQKNTAE